MKCFVILYSPLPCYMQLHNMGVQNPGSAPLGVWGPIVAAPVPQLCRGGGGYAPHIHVLAFYCIIVVFHTKSVHHCNCWCRLSRPLILLQPEPSLCHGSLAPLELGVKSLGISTQLASQLLLAIAGGLDGKPLPLNSRQCKFKSPDGIACFFFFFFLFSPLLFFFQGQPHTKQKKKVCKYKRWPARWLVAWS